MLPPLPIIICYNLLSSKWLSCFWFTIFLFIPALAIRVTSVSTWGPSKHPISQFLNPLEANELGLCLPKPPPRPDSKLGYHKKSPYLWNSAVLLLDHSLLSFQRSLLLRTLPGSFLSLLHPCHLLCFLISPWLPPAWFSSLLALYSLLEGTHLLHWLSLPSMCVWLLFLIYNA